MYTRLNLIWEGVKTTLSSCNPVQHIYKVSYFKKIWNPKIQMYDHQWTVVTGIKAYSALEAARSVDPELNPGYNCFSTRTDYKLGG
jgi:hypothetical protein